MRAFPHMQAEFPEFPPAELPQIPAAFDDSPCWRNDACPAFGAPALGLLVYVDRADPELRHMGGDPCTRFSLQRAPFDGDGAVCDTGTPVADSDDWRAILAAMIGEVFADKLRADLTPAEWADMRARNATPAYAGDVCASHNFCDANMPMLEAFEAVMGRQPAFLVEATEAATEADMGLWGEAWSHAKAKHLTEGAKLSPALAEALARVIACAESYLDDLESGLADGTYDDDPGAEASRAAIATVRQAFPA